MTGSVEHKEPVEISRDELYRQVWEAPMNRLAVQYGITGAGLAKICNRLKVPYPPRGHWAKKAAGKKTITYRLPPAEEGTQLSVTIVPTPSSERSPQSVEVKLKVDAARASASSIAVSALLIKPHPIIAQWLAQHEYRKREARRERDLGHRVLFDPGEFTEIDHRRHRILDALFKALENQGGKAVDDRQWKLYVEMQGERIDLQLYEKRRQVRRLLNDDEKHWTSANDKDWRQELQPTGRLAFTIKTRLPNNLKREWIERDDAPMESLLPDIVATFVTAGPLLVEQRRQQEESQRQWEIAEQRRQEEEQRLTLDCYRWRRFIELAQQQREAEAAYVFLHAMKSTNIDLQQEVAGESMAAWISWAEERIAAANLLRQGADAVFRAIGEVTIWTY